MSNRAGKHEREARNRRRRGWYYATGPNGAVLRPLKLGRKKSRAFSVSTRIAERFTLFVHGMDERPSWDMVAVPVTEAERRMDSQEEPKWLRESRSPAAPTEES